MDNCTAFRERDVIGICQHLLLFCDTNIITTPASTEHASSFHSFLPTLLTYIFGSPSTRGWLQTETRPDQDDAIRQLLDPHSSFVMSLVRLSTRSEYSYDMITEKFPDDIRKALTAGAIQYLPRVYENCAFLDKSKVAKTVDLRSAATRQSSVFPRSNIGEYRIRFNMLQFYLYYMISIATWPPLSPPSAAPSISSSTIPMATPLSYQSRSIYPMSSTPQTRPTPSLPPPQRTVTASGSSLSTTQSYSTSSANGNTSNELPYLLPGRLRPLADSIYDSLLRKYMQIYIPCVINDVKAYPTGVGTFFLDALVEIWVRTVSLSSSQKLSINYIQSLATFVRYIVSGDLRRCATFRNTLEKSAYVDVYQSVNEELYLLLSRLASNWRKHDDYIWVLDIYKLWAAPWRFGEGKITKVEPSSDLSLSSHPISSASTTKPTTTTAAANMKAASTTASASIAVPSSSKSPSAVVPSSTTTSSSSPLKEGWAYFVLENAWYYLPLVNLFLQRISTFTYPEKLRSQSSILPGAATSSASTSSAATSFIHNPKPRMITATGAPPPSSPIIEGDNIYGELNIFRQLLDLWKTKNLVELLSWIEDGLEVVAHEAGLSSVATTTPSFFVRASSTSQASSSSSLLSATSRQPHHQLSSFLSDARHRFSNRLNKQQQEEQEQQLEQEVLINLATACCGNKLDLATVKQHLCILSDRLLSLSGGIWKSSQIYSTRRQPRSENLVKSLDALGNAIHTRQHPQKESLLSGHGTWKTSMLGQKSQSPSSSPSSLLDIQALTSFAIELSTLLKLPLPDVSRSTLSKTPFLPPTSNNNAATSFRSATAVEKTGLTRAKTVQEPRHPSFRDRPTLPVLGTRSHVLIRSYENKYLAYWVLPIDNWVNAKYQYWVHPWLSFMPSRIPIRWFACTVNVFYIFLLCFVFYLYYYQ